MPNKKCIDRSKEQFTLCCLPPRALNMVEQPARLQTAEVRTQGKPRSFAKTVLPPIRGVTRHFIRNARVLPHNRIGDCSSCFLFPNDGCFSLVCDPDRSQLGGGNSARTQCFFSDFKRSRNNFGGIVFYPARLWIDLLVLLLRCANNAAVGIEHHEPCTRRTLINRSDIPFHVSSPRRVPAHREIRESSPGILLLPRQSVSNPTVSRAQAAKLPPAWLQSHPSSHTFAHRCGAPTDPRSFPPFRFGCSTQFPPGSPVVARQCVPSRPDSL